MIFVYISDFYYLCNRKTLNRQVMQRLLLSLFLVLISVLANAKLNTANQVLIDTLEYYVENIAKLKADREYFCNRDKADYRRLTTSVERLEKARDIGVRYLVSDLDSSMLYFKIALTEAKLCKDVDAQKYIEMQLYALMPTLGISHEALEGFYSIDYESLSPKLRPAYWRIATELYYTVQMTYPEGKEKDTYFVKARQSVDSLQSYYEPGEPVYNYLTAMSFVLRGEENLATANFIDVLPRLGDHPELKDFALRKISNHYRERPEYRQAYLSHLMQRAINTLNRGLIRPAVLAQLGGELIKEGYSDLGNQCIRLALETPDYSYSRTYTSFDRAYYSRLLSFEANSKRRMTQTILIVAIVAGAIFVSIIARLRILLNDREAALKAAQQKAINTREKAVVVNKYVTSMAFSAFEQLGDYNVHVLRKLMAGQAKDLYKDVESGDYMQRLNAKFFESFDAGFLATFPEFVPKLNQLLLPDKAIELLPGDRMTPELRIAAYMRLGITDSAKLAQALGLSLNTIYTYRNRLRGRAKNRETIEDEISRIV